MSAYTSISLLLKPLASQNRGAFVGALSSSLTQYPVPPELKTVLDQGQLVDPYTKLIPDMLEYAQGLEAYPVPERMEPDEAAGVFEIWMKDRALHSGMSIMIRQL